MPVPHPALWRGFLPFIEVNFSSREITTFWDAEQKFLNPNKEQDSHCVSLNNFHVQFDNPAICARQRLEQCGALHPSSPEHEPSSSSLPLPETIVTESDTLQHLTSVLSYFQDVAAMSNGSNHDVKCIARIVSTVGSVGIKCPRWHADHVPVCLVMIILGPGSRRCTL